jgi:hypothetical protein
MVACMLPGRASGVEFEVGYGWRLARVPPYEQPVPHPPSAPARHHDSRGRPPRLPSAMDMVYAHGA